MSTYYKCVRLDGTDFYTGSVQWAPPEDHECEWIVRHPTATEIGTAASAYLSVSTVATDCTGMAWPCRLLTVEAIGDVTIPSLSDLPSKRAGVAFRVTGELPAHEALGPQGEAVAALIDRARRLTADELDSLAAARSAAWDAARDAAWAAAWDAAWAAARDAAWDVAGATTWAASRAAARATAWDAARVAAWDAAGAAMWDAAMWDAAWDAARAAAGAAARALAVRDLISTEHYDALTRPWRATIGPIHPDDSALPIGGEQA